jgi:hypothetical protein
MNHEEIKAKLWRDVVIGRVNNPSINGETMAETANGIVNAYEKRFGKTKPSDGDNVIREYEDDQ